jgi:hypothetical protein
MVLKIESFLAMLERIFQPRQQDSTEGEWRFSPGDTRPETTGGKPFGAR